MQFHRPSTFGAGVISLPPAPQTVPYAGWVAPPSDRTNANRQLQWLEERIHEIHQQAGRLRQKHSQLLSASADRFVLEPLEASLKEMETELRTLENDRRNVARKVANMEKKEKERADKEALAAQAKAYHKLTMKRQSLFGPTSTQAAQKAVASSGLGGAVQRRTSMFQSTQDTTPAGMEPGGSHAEFMAMAASLSKAAANASGTTNPHTAANPNVDHSDLNWDSSMDQELFLERVAQRVHRDSIFEQQFGHLGEGKASSSSGRKQSVSRRPSALNVPRRSSTIHAQQPPPGARHRSTQSRSISFPHSGGHRGPVLIAEESDEDDDDEDDSDMTSDSEASDASDVYTPNSASSHGSASSGHHPHHHRAHSTLSRQGSNTSSNQGSTSSLASLSENNNNNNNNSSHAPHHTSASSTAATSATSPPFTSRKPSSTSSSRKRASAEGKSSYASASAKKSTPAYSSIDTAPHARPTFLAQAADISSSDLSTSLQNYLTHSNAPKGITATEALIDPHLREKISKALQAYIAAATQSALEGHDIVDHDDASSNASSQALAPAVPQPSREETLLWGLLMGALRTAEEEQLAIEWWADREKQLYLEVEQRRKRNEAALAARQLSESQRHGGRGSIIGLGGSGGGAAGGGMSRLVTMTAPSDYSNSYKPASSSPSLSNSTLMERHAQRGSLLNALSVAQEQLRQLKAAKHLNESALRQLNDAQRQKEFQARHGVLAAAFAANQQQLQKKLAQQNKIKSAAAAAVGPMGGGAQNAAVVGSGVSFQFQPNSGIVTVSNSAHIESMCRRFVLGVVNAALVNASTLAKQDRTIKDLKWAIAKARRIADLTKNGSINRPASARPKWISAVSVPTPMPRLSSEGDVTQFLTVEPEGLTRPLSAAVRLASDGGDEDEDEKSPLVQGPDGTFESPVREVRAGRGWKDANYVPHDFDAEAARDAQRKGINFVFPPPMISPPKQVQKTQIDPTPFLPQDGGRSVSPSKRGASASHSGNSINAIDAELNSFPMDVGRMPDATVVQEDESTRVAVEEWKHMRESRETAVATLQAAQALSNYHHQGGSGGHTMRLADPSLLGTPPPLHVSPAVAEDSWGTFVTALENVKNRNKKAAQVAVDSSRGPAGSNSNGPKIVLTVTGGPSKDPTNKTKPAAPTAAQRYAAAAKGSSNPLVDIPKKCLPRSIYEGCSLANPHPDKQPDACHMIQIRSRTLLAKARRLGLADVEKVMRANTKLFASHFHPGTNSFEWLPIDPLNPARKCVDGCRMHYNIDPMGLMTSTSPTRKKPGENNAAAGVMNEEEKQQAGDVADTRPKSARASSIRRSNSPTVKRQGSTGSRTARPSTAHPRSSTEQAAETQFGDSFSQHHNAHFASAGATSQSNGPTEESTDAAADSASRIFHIEVAKSRPATAHATIGREGDRSSPFVDMSLPPPAGAAASSRLMTPHPPSVAPLASPRSVSFRNVTIVIPKP